jgi:hypothetical protein
MRRGINTPHSERSAELSIVQINKVASYGENPVSKTLNYIGV